MGDGLTRARGKNVKSLKNPEHGQKRRSRFLGQEKAWGVLKMAASAEKPALHDIIEGRHRRLPGVPQSLGMREVPFSIWPIQTWVVFAVRVTAIVKGPAIR